MDSCHHTEWLDLGESLCYMWHGSCKLKERAAKMHRSSRRSRRHSPAPGSDIRDPCICLQRWNARVHAKTKGILPEVVLVVEAKFLAMVSAPRQAKARRSHDLWLSDDFFRCFSRITTWRDRGHPSEGGETHREVAFALRWNT